MEISFSLPRKAFSINKTYTRDARFKTKEFQLWYVDTFHSIKEASFHNKLLELAAEWLKSPKEVHVEYEVVYPEFIFYNKERNISSKTFDVTNTEKAFIDILFRDVLNINDKYITKLISSKRAGKTYEINITLKFIS